MDAEKQVLPWFLVVSASICMNLTGAAQMRIILGAMETNPQRRDKRRDKRKGAEVTLSHGGHVLLHVP